jgi:hypothetical protein
MSQVHPKMQSNTEKNMLERDQPLTDGQFYSISNNKKQVLIKNKRSSTIKPDEMACMMSDAINRVHAKLEGKYDENQVYDDEHTQLFKQMILQELANIKPKNKTSNIICSNNIHSTNEGYKNTRSIKSGSDTESSEDDGETDDEGGEF